MYQSGRFVSQSARPGERGQQELSVRFRERDPYLAMYPGELI